MRLAARVANGLESHSFAELVFASSTQPISDFSEWLVKAHPLRYPEHPFHDSLRSSTLKDGVGLSKRDVYLPRKLGTRASRKNGIDPTIDSADSADTAHVLAEQASDRCAAAPFTSRGRPRLRLVG
jgi:hypothetical protein